MSNIEAGYKCIIPTRPMNVDRSRYPEIEIALITTSTRVLARGVYLINI